MNKVFKSYGFWVFPRSLARM